MGGGANMAVRGEDAGDVGSGLRDTRQLTMVELMSRVKMVGRGV